MFIDYRRYVIDIYIEISIQYEGGQLPSNEELVLTLDNLREAQHMVTSGNHISPFRLNKH